MSSNVDCIDYRYHLSPLGNSDHSVLLINLSVKIEYKQSMNKYKYNKGDCISMTEYLDIDCSCLSRIYGIDAEGM